MALSSALRAREFDVHEAESGIAALELALDCDPDLVLLDLGLPDLDGLDVCRRLLELAPTPVIVVSADGDEERTLRAFELGVVDYVRKPFSTPVLVARIAVALRHAVAPATEPGARVLTDGDVRVDVLGRSATIAGRPLDLSARQFDLLVVLLRSDGRLLTHAALQRQLWGPGSPDRSTSLRNAVSLLRRQLGDAGGQPRIVTEPSLGYRWVSA